MRRSTSPPGRRTSSGTRWRSSRASPGRGAARACISGIPTATWSSSRRQASGGPGRGRDRSAVGAQWGRCRGAACCAPTSQVAARWACCGPYFLRRGVSILTGHEDRNHRAVTTETRNAASHTTRLAGYLFALSAGAVWGTTGPLSTALYREGEAITGIGFWRLLIGLVGFLVYGLLHPGLFRIDRRAWLLVGLGGGALVALFEVAYQFGIAGAGVAGAAALLYIAPVLVAILAKPLLGERLTALRLALAIVVMVGAALTVRGGSHGAGPAAIPLPSLIEGVAGGLLAMLSYAGTTLLARFAVPRYGATQVLFLEIVGGVAVLALVLPLAGHPPLPPHTTGAWTYVVLLSLGSVLAANFLFFAGVRRIDAAPTAVAATIEPVVGTLLALLLFDQRLSPLGWLGLAMVVGGVAAGYLKEAQERPDET
ncbi:MAG: hypothetical protein DMD36_07955 [Gemmatimonadetes bacterium]|nr:MAG: hypothetical protein DMD36_07955 [Gemmatimonadota bacterium]